MVPVKELTLLVAAFEFSHHLITLLKQSFKERWALNLNGRQIQRILIFESLNNFCGAFCICNHVAV
jgi:hypothetical protein